MAERPRPNPRSIRVAPWLAALILTIGAAGANAQGSTVSDPLSSFVKGFNPTGQDFFSRDSAHTFLVRMRFDADLDGREDLAITETSLFGNGGGPWLLFRREHSGQYRFLGEFFAGPSNVTVRRTRDGQIELTARATLGAGSTEQAHYRVTADTLARLPDVAGVEVSTDSVPAGPHTEWCALTDYTKQIAMCWHAGWPRQ